MPYSRDQDSQPSQNARIPAGSATLTGRKSGSISRITPPGRALGLRKILWTLYWRRAAYPAERFRTFPYGSAKIVL